MLVIPDRPGAAKLERNGPTAVFIRMRPHRSGESHGQARLRSVIGTYPSEDAARADYDIVKDLHAANAVGTYDASVVTKDIVGKVHVNKDEMATKHGAWGGAAVGAVVGILFPALDPRQRRRRGGGGRDRRPPVAWHVPGRRQGVRGHHR